MNSTYFVLLGILYLVCCVISYGVAFAYFQREYPLQAQKEYKNDKAFAIKVSLFGPISLIVISFTSNFYQHGLKFK